MAKLNARSEEPQSVELRTAKQVMIVVVIGLLLWLSLQLRVLLVDIVVAITLASAIAPLAEKAEKRGMPRAVTVMLTYVAIAVFYATAGYLLWAPIKEQTQLLIAHMPAILDNVTNWYDHQLAGFGFQASFQVTEADFKNFGKIALDKTLDVSAGALGILLNAILVLFLSAYFVVNAKSIWAGILQWVPAAKRDRAQSLIAPLENRMGGYVRGQALVSTAVATFFAIGLSIIGVKYALVLGLVAGILNLVPFVGSLITTILAVIIAANQSLLAAGLTLGLFVLEQTVESNFIVPFLLGSQVELDPLIVLFAILIGANLGGAIGALIAVPTAAALTLLAQEFYFKPLQTEEAAAS